MLLTQCRVKKMSRKPRRHGYCGRKRFVAGLSTMYAEETMNGERLRRNTERSLGKGGCLRRAPLHRHKTRLVVLAADQIDHGCVICSGLHGGSVIW